jgi:hypothetical protein
MNCESHRLYVDVLVVAGGIPSWERFLEKNNIPKVKGRPLKS